MQEFDLAVKDFTQLIEHCEHRKSLAETLLMRAMTYEASGDSKMAKIDI